MRRRFRFDHETQKVYEIPVSECEIGTSVQIAPDIQPYRSMITGEMITGRAQHREHLRRHGCQELGNEKPDLSKPDIGSPRGEIRDAVREANRQLQWGEAPRMDQLRDMAPAAMRELGVED